MLAESRIPSREGVVLEVTLLLFVFTVLKKKKKILRGVGRNYFKAISISSYFLAPESLCQGLQVKKYSHSGVFEKVQPKTGSEQVTTPKSSPQ